ncbi:hypothetical protein BDZ94DRAFT_1321378 [Collybia nuda]|uniref:Uncharacterized protein n=1 Tax=Collybia nuda TaxID=64659 RepID=A0A9P6CJ76_9AGAR|nr:hypothetical protein BDZ94DRAFT_1321378 [Collybia nuda]
MSNTQDLSNSILATIRDAASAPAGSITEVAAKHCVNISDIVRHSRNNKQRFEHLVGDARGLVYIIVRRHKDMTEIQSKELESVKELLKTLASIERFAAKETSRNFFTRMIRQKSDRRKIQGYRDIMRRSLGVFGLQVDRTIQDNIELFISQQAELEANLREQGDESAIGTRHTQKSSTERLANQVALDYGSEYQEYSVSVNISSSNTSQKTPHPKFPDIQSSHSNITVTTVGGDQVTTNRSRHISNINSGNTTTRIITGLNNNS